MRIVTRVRSPATGPSGPWTVVQTLAEYVVDQTFNELRMCPCYNMMPRELFENMNCRPTPDAVSMSQNYLHCQAVDTAPHYAEVAASANYTFAAVRAPCFPRRCLRARFPHRCLRAPKINTIPGA